MRTVIRSQKSEVIVNSEEHFIIIGEKINPTGRKKLARALEARDYKYIHELSVQQVAAGADILDVNVGAPGIDEVAILPEVARLIAEWVDTPISLELS